MTSFKPTTEIKKEAGVKNKRIQITIHPESIRKLDRIRERRQYKRSRMIDTLIREYDETKDNWRP